MFPFPSPDWSARWVYALSSDRIGGKVQLEDLARIKERFIQRTAEIYGTDVAAVAAKKDAHMLDPGCEAPVQTLHVADTHVMFIPRG
eukprot:8603453-Pyramimonas_sp.AAC.1